MGTANIDLASVRKSIEKQGFECNLSGYNMGSMAGICDSFKKIIFFGDDMSSYYLLSVYYYRNRQGTCDFKNAYIEGPYFNVDTGEFRSHREGVIKSWDTAGGLLRGLTPFVNKYQADIERKVQKGKRPHKLEQANSLKSMTEADRVAHIYKTVKEVDDVFSKGVCTKLKLGKVVDMDSLSRSGIKSKPIDKQIIKRRENQYTTLEFYMAKLYAHDMVVAYAISALSETPSRGLRNLVAYKETKVYKDDKGKISKYHRCDYGEVRIFKTLEDLNFCFKNVVGTGKQLNFAEFV